MDIKAAVAFEPGKPLRIETVHLEFPSPRNPLGMKGLGEGGAIGPPAAVANAVDDALADLGVVVRTCPLSPSRVRELIRSANVNTVDSAR